MAGALKDIVCSHASLPLRTGGLEAYRFCLQNRLEFGFRAELNKATRLDGLRDILKRLVQSSSRRVQVNIGTAT
jgi:hypothetical protein